MALLVPRSPAGVAILIVIKDIASGAGDIKGGIARSPSPAIGLIGFDEGFIVVIWAIMGEGHIICEA